ncbi:hypothetical protein BD324DRAFT_481731 [Kockovaella imperatae]|uniref:Uncharacterized protein n=1 Tax=Kockovaella imperatae TaxID=4999 RepID=A0A1Y1UDW4_9TREE|nr:hypothetical protein BD324DRAFT_481731 [Kockovaella imperatae]ORX36228.1 hypothetical protein BD324DRAFT_481731 [Kockovaella imperatae]
MRSANQGVLHSPTPYDKFLNIFHQSCTDVSIQVQVDLSCQWDAIEVSAAMDVWLTPPVCHVVSSATLLGRRQPKTFDYVLVFTSFPGQSIDSQRSPSMVLWRSNDPLPPKSQGMVCNLDKIVTSAWERKRPILHHLNADTTWLIQLPVPNPSTSSTSRRWFNVLIDPWLFGPQSDVASWFSKQWHAIPPALASVPDVENLCRKVETITPGQEDPFDSSDHAHPIDAIVLSHEFTDHTHQLTLCQMPKSTRVFAASKAAALVQSWNHFDSISEIPSLQDASEWRDQTISLIPEVNTGEHTKSWVKVGRLQKEGDAFYYHSALAIIFDLSSSSTPESAPVEAIVYTPHGVRAEALNVLQRSNDETDQTVHHPIQTLALLHGLHDVSLDWGQQLNLGAFNALSAQRVVESKYWIGTHDEVKKGGGLVSWFLRRKVYTVREALEAESKSDTNLEEPSEKSAGAGFWSRKPQTQGGGDELAHLEEGGVDVGGRGKYYELRTGESMVLS